MAPRFVGLDLGTTTVTGVLLDAGRGESLRLAQRHNDAAVDARLTTRAEQNPQRLRVLALEVLAELVDSSECLPAPIVDGIAVTGQMHGLLCVDGEGRPLTPLISWQDRRTTEPARAAETMWDRLCARVHDLDWEANGCRVEHGYGAATLFWLVQQGELPRGTHRVCTIADWLVGQLTGQPAVSDRTLAASWGVYNLVEDAWSAPFLGRLGLDPRLFPPVRPSGERLGGLASGIAREMGLPVGIPVHNALGDTQASFLGVSLSPAALPLPEEKILFNLGTGGQICWAVPAFEPPSALVETRPLPHGRFLRVGASLCGGAAYAWLNRTARAWLADFGLEVDEATAYRRLDALAALCEDPAGLSVRPTFLGVRGDPTIEAGTIEGITLGNLKLGALARATMVGMVDELHDLYRTHAEHARVAETVMPAYVVATGGGVCKNPMLPELIAARFGLPVRVPSQQETGAAGAAMLASGCESDPGRA